MTPWPGSQLPHPGLYLRRYRLSPDGRRFVFDPGRSDDEPPRMGTADAHRWEVGEAYLALLEVNLDSVEAIAGFVSRFGPLNVALDDFELVRGLRELPPAHEPLPGRPEAVWPEGLYANETVEEFRYGARCVRDIVTAWRWLQAGEQQPPRWASVRAAFHLYERREMADAGMEPDAVDAAQRVLREGLTWGLRPFHPFVGQLDEPAWIVGVTTSLYAACCLEFYNHLVEQAMLRTCRRCGQAFVRQRGRALHGRHRLEGVMYCSLQCAQAAASKEYRARKRKRKDGEA